jgi:Domain of unknown function (DUF6398)
MPFDIHQEVFDSHWDLDERRAARYKKDLLRHFKKSPEWKTARQDTGEAQPLWAETFLDFALGEVGLPLEVIDSQAVRDILYDLLPHKVIASAEEAPHIVRELQAFWQFLDREFQLPNAAACLRVLNQKTLVNRLRQAMSDSARFGVAKTVLMQALDAGVDITDPASLRPFIDAYNQQITARMEAADAPLSEALQQRLHEIVALAERVCREHLNEDYAHLSRALAEDLAHQHPSPLVKGQVRSWAAGIVYALGRVNFLFDPSQNPHLRATELCDLFEVSQNTASAKAKLIGDRLDLYPFAPEWTLPGLVEDNPLIWMVMVDGIPMDLRDAPREVQEEAYQQGLIPYIPADRGLQD